MRQLTDDEREEQQAARSVRQSPEVLKTYTYACSGYRDVKYEPVAEDEE